MCVFFGLELDSDTKRAVADWRDRYGLAHGQPVPADNFHLTLAFVGEVDHRHLETLTQAVDQWASGYTVGAGRLVLDQAGYWQKQRIYWLGPEQPQLELARLAVKLQNLAGPAGARRQRKLFVPHVTLFRSCAEPPPAPVVAPRIDVHYQHFTLFETLQGRQGVSYRALQHWPLNR
ncbi:RNA 2',3'-cyclic phosphodiesterase [Kineobactrum salinum]|uniref:RNA 2',3'-cyclic phosphodiesterase n=1 Tax=Kineobactrum salinum TaxID=2708301 RepID=A0A6C0U3G3_9GAMM|nr:RNA 2',3'-cyclic phosphodiesterase [Kineobactrum salinum]QIB66478.1 RNA 2',3'-cyclic phosphodiesterase [Kineobactrum salinum]